MKWGEPNNSGIIRRMVKHEPHHGKSGCDGFSNVPTHAMQDAIKTGTMLNPTTREMVLYLAENKQEPSIPKHKKRGWEAADRFFYGYMDSRLFTKFAVPDAVASGWGSKMFGEKVGMCADPSRAEKDGPLHVRNLFCACIPCIALKFDHCEMKRHVGKMQHATAPLAKGVATRRPQIESLEEWADKLTAGMIVAVRVASDEQRYENEYWLAKLVSCHEL